MSKLTMTEQRGISVGAAVKALALEFPKRPHKNYTVRKEDLVGNMYIRFFFHKKEPDDFLVEAQVSWPDGQEGYGSVEIVYQSESDPNLKVTRKFACWKKGRIVKVQLWYKPPGLYGFQTRYGLRYPRGSWMVSQFDPFEWAGMIMVILMVSVVFAALFAFLPIQEVFEMRPVAQKFVSHAIMVLGALFLGFLGYSTILGTFRLNTWTAWLNDINEVKSSNAKKAKKKADAAA